MILATARLNAVWKQTALVDADKRSSHLMCSHYCVLDGGCEMQPFWCLEVLLEVLLFTPIIFIIHYIGDRCKYCSTESNQPNQKKDILDFILSQIVLLNSREFWAYNHPLLPSHWNIIHDVGRNCNWIILLFCNIPCMATNRWTNCLNKRLNATQRSYIWTFDAEGCIYSPTTSFCLN